MEYNTFYAHVPVDIPHEYMKHVIGKNGRWFKYTMEQCSVSSIWFNKERNIVEIWGPFQNLEVAVLAIRSRIYRIKERYCDSDTIVNDTLQVNDEYTEFSIPKNENIKFVIGYKGNNLKEITRNSGASFIWYDKQRSSFQIWGEPSSFEIAETMIVQKMNEIEGRKPN